MSDSSSQRTYRARLIDTLQPLGDLFIRAVLWIIKRIVKLWIRYVTPYQVHVPSGIQRSGKEQEQDERYSPVGLRDREYRSYLELRLTGLLFATVGAVGLVSAAIEIGNGPIGIPELLIICILPAFALVLGIGAAVVSETASYPSERRIKR